MKRVRLTMSQALVQFLDNQYIELWFRMGHWKNYRDPLMPGKAQPSSGWLFNSIANKHADAMDNYPEPMVLPRAADDQATAQALSSVLPVVLEQADYEQVYSDVWWRKLKQGTGVTGIFWDPAARGGLGDIAVRSVNLLMLYWEPGVQDIQDSPDLFHLSLEDTARLTAQYPQLTGHAAAGHRPQRLRREGHELALAALPGDAEHPLLVVELPHQLNNKVALPCKGTVGALEHIPAQLAARLLQTAWCCMPARTTRRWRRADCTTTASTPLCSTRCSWRRIPLPGSATST